MPIEHNNTIDSIFPSTRGYLEAGDLFNTPDHDLAPSAMNDPGAYGHGWSDRWVVSDKFHAISREILVAYNK